MADAKALPASEKSIQRYEPAPIIRKPRSIASKQSPFGFAFGLLNLWSVLVSGAFSTVTFVIWGIWPKWLDDNREAWFAVVVVCAIVAGAYGAWAKERKRTCELEAASREPNFEGTIQYLVMGWTTGARVVGYIKYHLAKTGAAITIPHLAVRVTWNRSGVPHPHGFSRLGNDIEMRKLWPENMLGPLDLWKTDAANHLGPGEQTESGWLPMYNDGIPGWIFVTDADQTASDDRPAVMNLKGATLRVSFTNNETPPKEWETTCLVGDGEPLDFTDCAEEQQLRDAAIYTLEGLGTRRTL